MSTWWPINQMCTDRLWPFCAKESQRFLFCSLLPFYKTNSWLWKRIYEQETDWAVHTKFLFAQQQKLEWVRFRVYQPPTCTNVHSTLLKPLLETPGCITFNRCLLSSFPRSFLSPSSSRPQQTKILLSNLGWQVWKVKRRAEIKIRGRLGNLFHHWCAGRGALHQGLQRRPRIAWLYKELFKNCFPFIEPSCAGLVCGWSCYI